MPDPQSDDEAGTFVERTGLAVVHRGERIIATPESAAGLAPGTGGDVHFYFPIHVVMVGEIGEETKQEIESRIWDGLHDALG